MDHDLRYDAHAADPREAAQGEARQYDLPAVPANPTNETDNTVWAKTVDHRLARLEAAVERLADALQALILRLDDGK